MGFIRGFARVLSTLIFRGSLLMFAAFLVISLTIGSGSFVKNSLEHSGVYNNFSSLAVDALEQKSEASPQTDESFNDAVRRSIIDSLPPELIQTSLESFIDAFYDWFEGETSRPEIRIDLSEASASLSANLSKNALARLQALPECPPNTFTQQDQLEVSTTPCVPIGTDINAISQTFGEDFVENMGFTGEEAIFTTNDLPKDSNGFPFYEGDGSNLPRLYQVIKMMPWISGAAIIVFGLLVYLLHDKKRVAIKSISWSFAITSALLVLAVIGFWLLAHRVSETAPKDATALRAESIALLDYVIARINLVNGICAAIYASLATAGFILMHKQKTPMPHGPIETTDQTVSAQLPDTKSEIHNNVAKRKGNEQ